MKPCPMLLAHDSCDSCVAQLKSGHLLSGYGDVASGPAAPAVVRWQVQVHGFMHCLKHSVIKLGVRCAVHRLASYKIEECMRCEDTSLYKRVFQKGCDSNTQTNTIVIDRVAWFDML